MAYWAPHIQSACASSACTDLASCMIVPRVGQSMQDVASNTLGCARRSISQFIFVIWGAPYEAVCLAIDNKACCNGLEVSLLEVSNLELEGAGPGAGARSTNGVNQACGCTDQCIPVRAEAALKPLWQLSWPTEELFHCGCESSGGCALSYISPACCECCIRQLSQDFWP